MGCINSTKKIAELRGVTDGAGTLGAGGVGNGAAQVFRVHAERLKPNTTFSQIGYLKLTPREILFEPEGGTGPNAATLVWSLQHLRRYGINGQLFSFEAGRRCMTGVGIFTFRVTEAEPLYQLFRRYINNATTVTNNMIQLHGHTDTTPDEQSSYILGQTTTQSNNYLDPTQRAAAAARIDNFESSSPVSLHLDSPDSLASSSFGTNEVVHFTNNSRYPTQMQGAIARQVTQQSGNIYSERPLRQLCEHNNNNNSSQNNNRNDASTIMRDNSTVSALSNISRKLLIRRSMDIPPESCAPLLLTPTTPMRLYANVENWVDMQTSDCCYENLQNCDLPLLLPQSAPVISDAGMSGNNATTPGVLTRMASIADSESMSLGSGGETSTQAASLVNYIVLDLDQPRSPAAIGSQYSPKTPFGSAFSISAANTEADETSIPVNAVTPTYANNNANISNVTVFNTSNSTATNASTTATTSTTTIPNANATELVHDQLDYSTIDFVKTCALIKSSVNGIDFDVDPDPDMAEEESRITRHSKCVRKAYSISE